VCLLRDVGVPFWANFFSLVIQPVHFSSPFHLCANAIRKCVPVVDLCPHSLRLPRLIISLRYPDVNSIGIAHLPAVAPRSMRLRVVMHHSPTTSILESQCFGTGSLLTFVGMSTSTGRSGPISTKNHADKPAINCVGPYRTAYENSEVTVILSRGYPFDQGFRTCQDIRSSQKRPMRPLSGHLCVVFADRIVTLALFLRKMPGTLDLLCK
jgi:hypothetical protein